MAAPMVYLSCPKWELLLINSLILFLFNHSLIAENEHDLTDHLLCRQCGHGVTSAEHLRRKPSPAAIRQRNDTILGQPEVLIQLFENPHGKHFEVITASKADVFKYDQAVSSDTFFPGFSWRIAMCPRCGTHLGWSFEPLGYKHGKEDSEETFIGLILDSLLHQTFADSLLITPKSYYS